MKSLLLPLLFIASPAAAQEVFGGVLVHGVNTPLTFETHERGVDFQLGYRTDRIAALHPIGRPAVHVFASVNSRGDTDFVAAGLDWTLGKRRFYARPGVGIAVHDGPSYRDDGVFRTDLGSRVLFEPTFGIGYRVLPRLSVEYQWTHISHAQLFSGQNPGLDMMGVRLN